MPGHQDKNTINDNQDNMSLPEPNNTMTIGPEKDNTAKSKDKNSKITITNMFKDLKRLLIHPLIKCRKTQTKSGRKRRK